MATACHRFAVHVQDTPHCQPRGLVRQPQEEHLRTGASMLRPDEEAAGRVLLVVLVAEHGGEALLEASDLLAGAGEQPRELSIGALVREGMEAECEY